MIEIKTSRIRRKPVEVRPSRIRRDPLLVRPIETKKKPPRSREFEMWIGVAGIALFGAAIAAATMGFSVITASDKDDAPIAPSTAFGSCEGNPNCVVDGDTIRLAGQTVQIAGIATPDIHVPQCSAEGELGARAVQKLTALLNGGKVTLGATARDADGVMRTTVLVNGHDVAAAMIDAGVAQERGSIEPEWCS